jgi:hypothetical protein
MGKESTIIAIKPEQALAGLAAAATLFFFFKLVAATESSAGRTAAAGQGLSWYHHAQKKASLNHYFPGFAGDHTAKGIVGKSAWAVGYIPAAIPLVFLAAWATYSLAGAIFSKPESSLLEDPEFDVRHLGVDTPSLCHLPAILHVCPERDRASLVESLAIGEIDPYAPASSKVEIDDSPATYNG